MLVMLLSGCFLAPGGAEDSGQVADTGGVFGDCDPTVLQPPLIASGEGAPADAHADVVGAAPEPTLVRLQWPSSDPSRSAGLLWRTDLESLASVVEFGVSADALDQRVEGWSFTYGTSDEARMHEVRLCGLLQPETTYHYRVGGDASWSPVYSFTTPPAPGSTDSLRIALAGDSRGSYSTWGTVLAMMDSYEPDAIFVSGDLTERGSDLPEWDAYLEAGGEILTRRAIVPAHGNHEFLAQSYFANFSLPGNEQWYHHALGPLALVSLNDTLPDLDQRDVDQPAFIDEVFGASELAWFMVNHHQSMYSTCSRHGSYEELREAWGTRFDAHQVEVVVAGHNHVYERSVPVAGGVEAADGAGTVHLVTGGAGAPLYDEFAPEWFNSVATAVEHFIIADLGPETGVFTVYDLEGGVIDSFEVSVR